MKVKFSPVLYIFVFYICLSAYLVYAYFSFQQYLSGIEVVNLAPVAYGLLIFSSIFLALSLFSILRIPLFHYLFKMFHLWIVVLSSLILFFYFKYGHMLSDMFTMDTQQSIANTFPGAQPEMFKPLINLIQTGFKYFKEHVVVYYFIITIVLVIIQIILYMPSSLRYVYYTHISPIKYTFKHILVSLLLLAPLLFGANYYFRLDSSLNPEIERLLTADQQNVKDTDNVFFPMLTIWMPDIPDRISYGKQWISEDRQMLAMFKNINKPVTPVEYPGYRKLLLGGMSKTDQAAINQLFVKRLQKNDIKLDESIYNYVKKYQTPLKLAQSFYGFQYYRNPVNYTDRSYTDFYSDYSESFLSLERLNLLASLIGHGADLRPTIKNISDDYFFNLRMIRSSSDPNVKLLYIEKQSVIVQFLYNLLQNPAFQNGAIYNYINNLPTLIKTVIDQKRIARKNILLLKNQLDLAAQHLSANQSPTAKIIEYTYKYNKTLNCIYSHAERAYNLDNQEISDYIKRQKSVILKADLDNMIGNVICEAGIPHVKSDIYIKAVETNGRIMILKGRSKLYEDKINEVNIGSFLTNHSDKYYNPFTGEALKWDRDANQIYFKYNTGKENVKVSY